MNPILKEIVETGCCRSESGEVFKLEYQVPVDVGEFLGSVVAEVKPQRSLEVGLAFGISAMYICDALPKSPPPQHLVIDPGQMGPDFKGTGLYNLRRAGYGDLIEFREQPSQQALPQLEAEGRRFDFAFIDGIHTFDHALVDFFYVDRMLRVGGVVAFDDVGWPGIHKLCRFIATNRAYRMFRCQKTALQPRNTLQHRALAAIAARVKKVRDVLSPEFLQPDIELGLWPGCRCAAFQKLGEDSRLWKEDTHRMF